MTSPPNVISPQTRPSQDASCRGSILGDNRIVNPRTLIIYSHKAFTIKPNERALATT